MDQAARRIEHPEPREGRRRSLWVGVAYGLLIDGGLFVAVFFLAGMHFAEGYSWIVSLGGTAALCYLAGMGLDRLEPRAQSTAFAVFVLSPVWLAYFALAARAEPDAFRLWHAVLMLLLKDMILGTLLVAPLIARRAREGRMGARSESPADHRSEPPIQ